MLRIVSVPTPGPRIYARRYEILSSLGTGSFGEVYKVLDHNLNRVGALKLLKAVSSASDPWAEAHMLMALDGPFVLRVQNAAVFQGQQYIVTDLAETGSVSSHIQAAVGMPVEQARLWGRDMSRGVERMHKQGLLHCDLKPDNIFVSATNSALVGDVGLAQKCDVNGLVDAAGTMTTMAPEVAAAAATGVPRCYSVRSDVFSIAATLYWMLTGSPVKPAAQTYADVVAMKIPDIWDIAAHVPNQLRTAVMKALDPDPANRFASAADFDSAIGGVPIPSRRWDRVTPHTSHEQCFVGSGRKSAIDLCVAPVPGRAFVQLSGSYASGRAIAAMTRKVRRSQLSTAIRSAIRNAP
jgi:serine/threonine protein kinase